MSLKKWIVAQADKEKASVISEKLNIDPFIAFLLVSRGVDNELSALNFLSSACEITSPFSLIDMDKAVDRINTALENDEKICIYGDYDCDGVTSTALLYSFFESIGSDVIYYIPNRISDGYGMNTSAIDYIKSQGTDLIITVDNGISAIEEADYIESLGMDLIVTDHHQIGDKLPKAVAVINPHRHENEMNFCDYAGVGVAFKLACAVYDGDAGDLLEQYADLVAIGTIGDVVPLKNENRCITKYGINLINQSSRLGIAALRQAAGNYDSELSAVDIAFQICPRINAAGRMDDANRAVELLLSDDYEEARFKAQQLNDENIHRHQVETNILDSIKDKINNDSNLSQDRVIVIDGEGYHHGVIGIVAAHLVTCYNKPAIVIGVDENGDCTGSARSIEGFNIYEAISNCGNLLTHFGGHPLAAGLGIKKEDIPEFRKQINLFARDNYPVMPVQTLKLDCKLSPFYINLDLVDSLVALEPYGAENPEAVFGLFNVNLISVTPVSDGKHVRFEVEKKGKVFKIIQFRTAVGDVVYKRGDKLDFAVKISKSLYKGKYYLSIKSVGVRKSGIDDDRYFKEKADYELFNLGNNSETEIYPDRKCFTEVYKFLRQNNGWKYTLEDLYFALDQVVSYGQLCYAVKAFEEAGLVSLSDSSITLNNYKGKADLENTNVIKTLKGRLNIE